MYNISICVNDDTTADLLDRTLRCYFTAREIRSRIRRFLSPDELARYSGYTDIVFLDADMNDTACVRVGRLLLSKNPGIILYIISDKYTYLDYAMDLRAFRYLEKNIDIDRLFTSLDIVTTKLRRVSFVTNYVNVSLKESEIVCVYSKDRKTYVLSDTGVEYPTTISMKKWYHKLCNNPNFKQPHYSYIVNMGYVISFDGVKIILRCNDGKRIEIFPSQRKISEFKKSFFTAVMK